MVQLSTFVPPVAGRFADKLGGKWILFAGLLLWTIGMWTLVEFTTVDSTRWSLLPSLLIAGVGLGMTFAPLQTIAMLNIKPQVAGAASGFINTPRQLGAVIGSAAVGALLQAQLATQLPESAEENAAALPAQFGDQFVEGFSNAASSGLQVGAGQTGVQLPPGVPEEAKPSILEAATKTFHEGYVTAMHYTLLLPLCVLAVAVVLVLFVRRQPSPAGGAEPASAAAASASQAARTVTSVGPQVELHEPTSRRSMITGNRGRPPLSTAGDRVGSARDPRDAGPVPATSRCRCQAGADGDGASMPASLRWPGVMCVGAPVSGSAPDAVLGKAMTSRIDSVLASSAHSRSKPKAMPPWGGGPYLNASRRKPNFSSACSLLRPMTSKTRC